MLAGLGPTVGPGSRWHAKSSTAQLPVPDGQSLKVRQAAAGDVCQDSSLT